MADGQAVEAKGTNPQSGGVLNTVVGTGLGLATASYNDKRQVRLSRKIGQDQVKNAQEMARFNQQLGLETWEKTGYGAQRKQLQDAGLNVGLMYGQAGGGGTTQTAPGGYTTPTAPHNGGEMGMGIQAAMAMAMLKAQIENTQADTALKKTEATKKGGVDTANVEASTGNILQKTESEKINTALMGWEEKIKQIEMRVKDNTEMDAINAIKLANEETIEEIRSKRTEANVKEGTQEEIIKQLNTASAEQALRIEAQKKGLIKTDAEIGSIQQGIKKMITEVNMMVQGNMRAWDQMSQKDKEIAISKKITEIQQQNADFNTSTPEQIKQWTNLIISVIPIANLGSGSKPIGFQR